VQGVLRTRQAESLQYGGGQGYPELRARLADLMAEEGAVADPESIVVTGGAQQALDLIGKVFVDPGDEIVVEAPSYVGALSAFSAYEPRYVSIAMDDDGMIVEEWRRPWSAARVPSSSIPCRTSTIPPA
jgi:DNA-binding transcriptional MocR family regulator